MKKAMIALICICLSSQALAGEPPRVLYMEVNQGQDMISRDNPAFRRIFDHTGNFLQHENIRLFEEGRDIVGGRSFDEAMDIASQAKRKKLDAVVLVSVDQKTRHSNGKLKDRLIASAKIIDAQTLELVDIIRVKSPVAILSDRECSDECRNMITRRHVREILPEFKDKLAIRLIDYRPRVAEVKKSPSELTLTLKGFKEREVYYLEDRIQRLAGTRDLSSLRSNPSKPAYWLERRQDADNVRDELAEVLASLNLKARIIQTERQVTLIKVNQDLAYLD